ncbi:hypothetical protein CQ018_09410 [Arthrobacter sp. MYb227]|uniref:hypothetical protein n=1 Tax=Arthrobacter sp. MYb227 TaxID=1848601 RepID=UPI000D4AD36B|nr:hypothetical protein [Arthrobacter sp. MYb227]PQZ93851.1 hypothetical protein CQ018_09410 [Arthrobacter sp. MYb227]
MSENDLKLQTIQMPTIDWLLIDGTIDNVAAISMDEPARVKRCSHIRETGWQAHPDWPTDIEALDNWPPAEKISQIELSGSDWHLIIDSLADVEADLMLAADASMPAEEREYHALIAARSQEIAGFLQQKLDS